jgi:hypothetical protein
MTWGDEGGERAVLELELKEMLMDKECFFFGKADG